MTLTEDETKMFYLVRLEITGVEAADAGTYKAVARNATGEGHATINLTFEEGEWSLVGQAGRQFGRGREGRAEAPLTCSQANLSNFRFYTFRHCLYCVAPILSALIQIHDL